MDKRTPSAPLENQPSDDETGTLGTECSLLATELLRERARVLNGEAERRVLAATIDELERFNEALLRELAARDRIIAERAADVEQLRDAHRQAVLSLQEAEAGRDRIHDRLVAVEASTTWKLGHPIRRVLENAPRLRRLARSIAGTRWWAGTDRTPR